MKDSAFEQWWRGAEEASAHSPGHNPNLLKEAYKSVAKAAYAAGQKTQQEQLEIIGEKVAAIYQNVGRLRGMNVSGTGSQERFDIIEPLLDALQEVERDCDAAIRQGSL